MDQSASPGSKAFELVLSEISNPETNPVLTLTASRVQLACQILNQRRFTRAIDPDESDPHLRSNRQAHVIEHGLVEPSSMDSIFSKGLGIRNGTGNSKSNVYRRAQPRPAPYGPAP